MEFNGCYNVNQTKIINTTCILVHLYEMNFNKILLKLDDYKLPSFTLNNIY